MNAWLSSKRPVDDRDFRELASGIGFQPFQALEFDGGALFSAWGDSQDDRIVAPYTRILYRSKLGPVSAMDHGDLEMHVRSKVEDEVRDVVPWLASSRSAYQLARAAAQQRRGLDERPTLRVPRRLRPVVIAINRLQARSGRLAGLDEETWKDAKLPNSISVLGSKRKAYPGDQWLEDLRRNFLYWLDAARIDLGLSRQVADSLLQLRTSRAILFLAGVAAVGQLMAILIALALRSAR